MNPNLLKTFVSIAQSGSITRAARGLGMTQPAVSSQLQALEAQFGARLFHRETRGVSLTKIGEQLLNEVADHMEAVESAFESLRARSTAMTGIVRFGGPAEFVGAKLPAILVGLSDLGLDLRLTLGGRAHLYNAFETGDIDLGITASEPQSTALGFQPIFREELVLVGSPVASRMFARHATALAGLQAMSLVAYDDALPLVRSYTTAVFATGPDTRPQITVPSLSILRDIVKAGKGISVLPRYLCEDELNAGSLVILHKPERIPSNLLFLVWRKEAMRIPRVVYARDQILNGLDEL